MTIKQFQERFHEYETVDRAEAIRNAMKLKVIDDEGKEHKVIPMEFGGKYCLLLVAAANVVRELSLNSTSITHGVEQKGQR